MNTFANIDAGDVLLDTEVNYFKQKIRQAGLPFGDALHPSENSKEVERHLAIIAKHKGDSGLLAARNCLSKSLEALKRNVEKYPTLVPLWKRDNNAFRKDWRDKFYRYLVGELRKLESSLGIDFRSGSFIPPSFRAESQQTKLDEILGAVHEVRADVNAGRQEARAQMDEVKATVKEAAAKPRPAASGTRDKRDDWGPAELVGLESFLWYQCGTREVPDLRSVPGGAEALFDHFEPELPAARP